MGERDNKDDDCTEKLDPMTLQIKKGDYDFSSSTNATSTYVFDAVFAPGTQDEVFDECRDLVQSAADGYNVTIFAYGQTGAGKTFTMSGNKDIPGCTGVAQRTMHEIFRVVKHGGDRYNYTISCTLLELYKTDLKDLLHVGKSRSAESNIINVRIDKAGNVI